MTTQMKALKTIIAALAAALSLVACSKSGADDEGSAEKNVPYQLRLEANSLDSWKEGDQVHVYHRLSGGSSFIDDGAFTLTDPSGKDFAGKLATGLVDGKSYDWKVVYPYTSDGSATISTDYLTQDGYGASAHLKSDAMPLLGTLNGERAASARTIIEMKNGFATVAVKVTNKCLYPVPFSSVKIGSCTVFVPDAPEVEVGSSATFYVPVVESDATGKAKMYVNGVESLIDLTATAGQSASVDYAYQAHKIDVVDSKVYTGSRYSTFTSMVFFGKKYYVAFRESDTEYCHHGAANMKEKAYVVICSSEDGVKWSKETTLVHEKYDCHDPKLVVSLDGSKLLVYHGITIPADGALRDPCTGIWTMELGKDGKLAELSYNTVDMGSKSCYWLWGITKHNGYYYGVGYYYYDEGKPTLFRSKDGVKYEQVSEFIVEGNEASPIFFGERLYVFFRSVQTYDCYVSWADAPYTDWHTKTYKFTMHAPHAIQVWDKILVAMRYNMHSNSICCYDPATENFDLVHTTFTHETSSDVGYPGMILHNGAVHVCWYGPEKGKDKTPTIFYQSLGLGKIYGLTN